MFRFAIRNATQLALKNPRILAPRVPVSGSITKWNVAHIRLNSTTALFKPENQQMMIAFTCKKCDTRSSHTFSKQGYTHGSVAIQCPGCKNRHLISDNLGIFRDNKVNLEELLKAKGENVATSTDALVFEDIPDSLKSTLGHYAKDAPEEYQEKDASHPTGLPQSTQSTTDEKDAK